MSILQFHPILIKQCHFRICLWGLPVLLQICRVYGGKGSFKKCMRGCACQTSKFWLLLYLFCPHLPPIGIPISYKKHPVLLKLGTFFYNLFKMDPIYVNRHLPLLWKPPEPYQFCEKHPKMHAHTRITLPRDYLPVSICQCTVFLHNSHRKWSTSGFSRF